MPEPKPVTVTTKVTIKAEHEDRYEAQRIADREAALRLANPVVDGVSLIDWHGVWCVSAVYVEGDLR